MYDLAKWLAQPYTLLLLAMGAGLVRSVRKVRTKALAVVIAAYSLLIVASVPCTSHLVFRLVESKYGPVDVTPLPSDTIVLLTGNIHRANEIQPYNQLAESSLVRCDYAAYLYQKGRCRILVAGGKVNPATPGAPCAEVLRDYLKTLGVDPMDLAVEVESRNTRESAIQCRRLLGMSIGRLILVTEAYHMRRSMATFEEQGLQPVAAPCNFRATEFEWTWKKFVPGPQSLAAFHTAVHELLGFAWYRLT